MRKTLLTLAAALLGSASAVALSPSIIENQAIYHYSADGNWAAAEDFYSSTGALINVVTGEMIVLHPDDMGLIRVGQGNCVSNSGTLLYNRDLACNEGYYLKNGEEHILPMAEGYRVAIPNAITPDDRYIVGLGGYAMYNGDRGSHKVFPLRWTLQDDGTYGEPEALDYPDKDFQGLMPQTIIPNCISNDGRVIAGQMVSNNGNLLKNIVWRLGDDGNWSYQLLAEELYHGEGIVEPGPPPTTHEPNPVDYMSEENRKAYLEEMAKYEEDWMHYPSPNYEDYMSAEELAAYEEAKNYYMFGSDPSQFDLDNQAWEEWAAGNNRYYHQVPSFAQNSISLSSNGRYLSVANASAEYGETSHCAAYFFDLETGEYVVKSHPDSGIYPTGIGNDGTMVGYGDGYDSFICEVGDKDFKLLTTYMNEKYPAIYDWMRENMRHDVTVTYWDDVQEKDVEKVYHDIWLVGQPRMGADGTLIGTWVENIWDYNDPVYLYSYVLPLNGFVGIDNISADNAAVNALNLSIDRNGVISINGTAKALNVYDINGRLMLNVENPASTVKTNLTPGSYLIKAENADTEAVAKVVL